MRSKTTTLGLMAKTGHLLLSNAHIAERTTDGELLEERAPKLFILT